MELQSGWRKKRPSNGNDKIGQFISDTLRATRATNRKDWVAARDLWQKCLNKQKKHAPVEVYLGLSESLRQLGLFTQAEQVTNSAIKKYGGVQLLLIELAEISSSRKDWHTAVNRWAKVIDMSLDNPKEKSYVRLIDAYVKLDATNNAVSTAQKALKTLPESIAVKVAHANMLSQLSKNTIAKKAWNSLLNEHEKQLPPYVLSQAAEFFANIGELKEAKALVSNSLKRYGYHPALLIVKAQISTSNQQWQSALKHWEFVLSESDDKLSDYQSLLCRFNISVIKRIINIDTYSESIKKYKKAKTKKKYAVFTSYTAGFDELKLPEVIDTDFEYFVFTNDKDINNSVFNILPLPNVESDPARITKYVKTHPHTLLKSYETVIWVDANILIAGDIKPLLKKFLTSNQPIASTPHQYRNSVQEELEACINLGKDDPDIMKKQVNKYLSEGFDGNILAENGVLFFNLKHPKLEALLETWWNEIRNGSKRDQLSFGYSLYKNNVGWHHIIEKPESVRSISEFILTNHFEKSDVYNILVNKLKSNRII